MEWYEQWAHQAYVDETDVLLYIPGCKDPDCLVDPHVCLRYCVPDCDYGGTKKQLIRELLLGGGQPAHFERPFRHPGRMKEKHPRQSLAPVPTVRPLLLP